MKEYKIRGNTIRLDEGKVFITDSEKPVAQNIKFIAISHKVGYDENNKRKYFLIGSVGFLGSKYNRATFYGVDKVIIDEENNSMEVYILI